MSQHLNIKGGGAVTRDKGGAGPGLRGRHGGGRGAAAAHCGRAGDKVSSEQSIDPDMSHSLVTQ